MSCTIDPVLLRSPACARRAPRQLDVRGQKVRQWPQLVQAEWPTVVLGAFFSLKRVGCWKRTRQLHMNSAASHFLLPPSTLPFSGFVLIRPHRASGHVSPMPRLEAASGDAARGRGVALQRLPWRSGEVPRGAACGGRL